MSEEKVKEEIVSQKMLLTVLDETLEEMQNANKSLKEIGERIGNLAAKIGTLEIRVQAFEQKEIRIEPPDLGPVSERVSAECAGLKKVTEAGLLKVAVAVETQPKPIVRRITFFPENDQEGNYKTLIRWMIGGIVGLMLIGSAYVVANAWIQRTPRWQKIATGMETHLSTDTPAVARPATSPAGKPVKHPRKPKKNLLPVVKVL